MDKEKSKEADEVSRLSKAELVSLVLELTESINDAKELLGNHYWPGGSLADAIRRAVYEAEKNAVIAHDKADVKYVHNGEIEKLQKDVENVAGVARETLTMLEAEMKEYAKERNRIFTRIANLESEAKSAFLESCIAKNLKEPIGKAVLEGFKDASSPKREFTACGFCLHNGKVGRFGWDPKASEPMGEDQNGTPLYDADKVCIIFNTEPRFGYIRKYKRSQCWIDFIDSGRTMHINFSDIWLVKAGPNNPNYRAES
jgi:cell division protein FtsB